MSRFWRSDEEKAPREAAPAVVLIGEGHRRAYLKHLLGDRAKIAGELASDRRVELLAEVGPEVVIVDCASRGINPLITLPRLSALKGPRIVALTDVPPELDGDILPGLGADVAAYIRDPLAIVRAVGLDVVEDHPGEHAPVAA